MKLKGVNPLEQHIEKIVLGLMLVVLLAVIAMQFVTHPNSIKDGTRTIAPDQVYTALESQANQLQSQLTDQNPSLPEVKSVDLVARYNRAFESTEDGRTQLSSALGQGVSIALAMGASVGEIVPQGEGSVSALAVPQTSTPVAASQWATLDPYALLEVPEYADFVPSQQPYDFVSVTVEANFSGKDLQAALNGAGGGNAIPRRFWSATGLAIMGFEAERQKLMPDGSWGEATPIVTPPYTPIPTRAIGPGAGLQDLTGLVTKAAQAREDVARPMFPPTIAGMVWEPPSDRVAVADESQSAKLGRIRRQLDRARSDLERLTNAPGAAPAGRPGGGGGKTVRDRTQPTTTAPSRGTQEKVQRLRDRIKELEDQLKELGGEDQATTTGRTGRTSRSDVRSVLEEESVELWAHDMGVEAGATYRYHTRVVVNNPLFRKGAELDPDDPEQQALTASPFARGAWSEWSSPVVAGAKEYFFVTGAERDGGMGDTGPKATVELYQMFYGHYRKSTLSVSPGDDLAGTIRISGNLLSFDTSVLKVADAAKAVEGLLSPTDSASTGSGGTTTALPAGISELSSRLTIDLGVYMLDVYPGQASTETVLGQKVIPMRVVLRDRQGNVIVRSDVQDKSSASYALASASASASTDTPLRLPGSEPAKSPAADLFPPLKGP